MTIVSVARRRMREFVLGLFACSAMLTVVDADDWLQWRGPGRSDRSVESGLLPDWGEKGPKRIWMYDQAGLGYAGFAIADDRLLTMGLDGEMEFALCLNAQTGKEIWRQKIGDVYENAWGDGPRSTPTVDKERVYFMSGRGDLACLNLADGGRQWVVDMQSFGGAIPKWGYAESPLVDGELVYCTPGGSQGAIVALDKNTGEKVWQCQSLDDEAHYSSMIAVNHNGARQVIQLLVSKVVGLNAADGQLLWESEWDGRIAVIPTPIFKDGMVYVTSGYGVGCAALRIGDDNQVEVLYRNQVMKNHHGGVIEVDGHVYGFSDKVGFVCQNFESGEKIWNDKKLVSKGAVSYADGRFYFIQEKDGQVVLMDANPDGLTEKGRFQLSPQTSRRKPKGKIWVHPVIADGKLYLRDQELIYCFDIKQ